MPFPIETRRLRLRVFEDRDIHPFAGYRSDPDVARYQGWEAPFSLEQATHFIDGMKAQIPGELGAWCQIAIERKAGGDLIGDCAFIRLGEDPRQAGLEEPPPGRRRFWTTFLTSWVCTGCAQTVTRGTAARSTCSRA